LIDLYLKTNFKLADKHTLAVHGHYFMSPVTLYDTRTLLPSTVEISSGLGVEIDLVYKFVVQKDFNIQVGYSHMLPQESMEAIKKYNPADATDIMGSGKNPNGLYNWAFVMLQFKPQLFSSKK
jgi:hypothetical protein